MCLVVEGSIFEAIEPGLTGYRQDLEADGYEVVVVEFVSGSAEDLRALLASMYAEPASLVGAVLIGNLPCVIYEMMQQFGNDPVEYEDFPCDLFYMDLDGIWSDTLNDQQVQAGNGKYDTRSGRGDLEIWVARLRADALPSLGSEAMLLRTYFAKSRAYREGTLHADCQALVYPDDDWSYRGDEDRISIGLNYGARGTLLIDDPNSTTASDYLSRIEQPYELIHTRSHGYAQGHMYYRNDYLNKDWVHVSDYIVRDPPALFYSYYVCSGSDYTETNYLTGIAALNPQSGLVAWGSTKTGGMWDDESFYTSLAAGSSFGEAFRRWYNIMSARFPSYAPHWWYGMALTGDASISLSRFLDVPRCHWAFGEVSACQRSGIVGGYEDGAYHADWPVTRDQMAVYIARALVAPSGEAGLADYAPVDPRNFPDAPPTGCGDDGTEPFWAYTHIEYCVENGVVAGYEDGAYHPEYQVTRDQMAVYVARAMVAPLGDDGLADYVPPASPTFPDVPSDFWAYRHIEYCAENGVLRGYVGGNYCSGIVVTRDQMAVYIARAFGLVL